MKVLICTAIYPTPENPAFGSFVRTQEESLRRAGVDVEVLVLNGRFRKLIYPKGVIQLHQRLSAGRFDLVHAHFSYVGMVARMQSRVPVVVTYHGDDLLGTVSEKGGKTWWSRPAVAAGKMLARTVDAAVVQSAEMASKLSHSNVFVIPHEVDFETFRPMERQQSRAALGLDAGKRYLLFAANPQIPVKRYPLAIAVFEHLARQLDSLELLVVYKETQERLALYMNACDALIFPSYQEGSPNIVKQAMACNLPIVATDVGDVREVIGQTEGCYVCDPTIPDFVRGITAILSGPRRTNGREHIRHLEPLAVARQVIDVYESVSLQRSRRAIGRTAARALAFRK